MTSYKMNSIKMGIRQDLTQWESVGLSKVSKLQTNNYYQQGMALLENQMYHQLKDFGNKTTL